MTVARYADNPILIPDKFHPWEAVASFNGCVIKDEKYRLVYRAISSQQKFHGVDIKLNTIGYAESTDGKHFANRSQLITPQNDWEQYGCEDPRITKIDGKYYIFYTAISTYPPYPVGIKVAVAVTKDLQTIDEKHLVTPFNAKAMALFPERINGKLCAVLTPDTDIPPAKISIAYFDNEQQIWDQNYWKDWYANISRHVIPLLRNSRDQVEVGAPPLKTDKGWLLIYCYIKNYFAPPRTIGVEAVLLDLNDPRQIISRTDNSLLIPEKYYEEYGDVPEIVFPSGALIEGDQLSIYYGAADTTCALATVKLDELLNNMTNSKQIYPITNTLKDLFVRYEGNPILLPDKTHLWESKTAFNTAAILENQSVHLLYRAQDRNNLSTIGYASTKDGFHIDERLPEPIYRGKELFEILGCEDPRITRIDDKIYMLYTAVTSGTDGLFWCVGMTSISVSDFINKHWNWSKPIVISPANVRDKDACILPEKINGKYVFFHRLEPGIWIDDSIEDLTFSNKKWMTGTLILRPREGFWDDERVGIGGVPIKTELGWLLIYHGITKYDNKYRLGVALLDLNNPKKVIFRSKDPIFEPEAGYENNGLRGGTVFTNGHIIKDDTLFIYYGAADQYTAVARAHFPTLLERINKLMK